MSEEAAAVLKKYSVAWRAEGLEEGMEKGMKKGIKKGIKKGRSEGLSQGLTRTARAMLREGIPIDTIARCTSLPIEEIERLKAEPAT